MKIGDSPKNKIGMSALVLSWLDLSLNGASCRRNFNEQKPLGWHWCMNTVHIVQSIVADVHGVSLTILGNNFCVRGKCIFKYDFFLFTFSLFVNEMIPCCHSLPCEKCCAQKPCCVSFIKWKTAFLSAIGNLVLDARHKWKKLTSRDHFHQPALHLICLLIKLRVFLREKSAFLAEIWITSNSQGGLN